MSLKVEAIIKRANGLRVKIETRIVTDEYGRLADGKHFHYSSYVGVCEPRKRTWRAPMKGEGATSDEIYQSQLKLWQSLKPTKNTDLFNTGKHE